MYCGREARVGGLGGGEWSEIRLNALLFMGLLAFSCDYVSSELFCLYVEGGRGSRGAGPVDRLGEGVDLVKQRIDELYKCFERSGQYASVIWRWLLLFFLLLFFLFFFFSSFFF